jgi:hypothetical protein
MRTFCACIAVVFSACSGTGVLPSSSPVLTSVQPLTGPVGTRVTIVGTGFSDSGNTINFGASAYPNVPSVNGTIMFVIPMAINPPCRNVTPPCEIATALITPGNYMLSVTTAQGTSNAVTFAVS